MNLKQARQLKSLNQIELAEKTGIHQTTISRLECNRAGPTPEQKAILKKFFDVPIDWPQPRVDRIVLLRKLNGTSIITNYISNGVRFRKDIQRKDGLIAIKNYDDREKLLNVEIYEKKKKGSRSRTIMRKK